MRYQLVMLGQPMGSQRQDLDLAVKGTFHSLGLDPDTFLEVLDSTGTTSVDWTAMPVAVWFGGAGAPSTDDLSLLQTFLKEMFPVFPVVDDLAHYQELVPKLLFPINGQEWKK